MHQHRPLPPDLCLLLQLSKAKHLAVKAQLTRRHKLQGRLEISAQIEDLVRTYQNILGKKQLNPRTTKRYLDQQIDPGLPRRIEKPETNPNCGKSLNRYYSYHARSKV